LIVTLSTWLAFFVASWLISLSPGAGAISCMTGLFVAAGALLATFRRAA
jgi:hypothetical protein